MAITYGPDVPIEQRLRPGAEFHQKILSRLQARKNLSEQKMSSRYNAWREVDDHDRMFLDLTRKAKKGDKTEDTTKREMPFKRGIVIPASKAMKQVRVTQLCSLYLHREPPLQTEGTGPEDIKPGKLMEATLAYDTRQMRYPLVIYQLVNDAERYGLAAIYDVWETESGWIKPTNGNPIAGLLRTIGLLPEKTWGVTREYNCWRSVDPYNLWRDPRVSVANVQEGEFIGHRFYRGYTYLLERTLQRNGPYFNIEELKKKRGGTQGAQTRQLSGSTINRHADDDFDLTASADEKDHGYFGLDHIQVKLVPRDWELGEEDIPQIWWFTMADESTIVRAHRSSYDHGRFTYSLAENNPDQHVIHNPGTIENLDGIQRTIDWLYNSHIENARKILNDSLIILPSLIEMEDILNPGPARHIRLSPLGEKLVIEGRLTPQQIVFQLQVFDFTKNHLSTAAALLDMGQRLSAANDTAQGQPTPEKRTLGEIQSLNAAASQQLSILARVIDVMVMAPLAERAIANRQQFTSMEQFFRIAGDLAKENQGENRMLISRDQIQGHFDYVAHSAILPADPARQAELWISLMRTAAEFPIVSQPGPDGKYLDLREVFNEAARTAGIRNIETFYNQMPMQPQLPAAPPTVLPDEQFQAGVAAGNYVPMEQAQAARVVQ